MKPSDSFFQNDVSLITTYYMIIMTFLRTQVNRHLILDIVNVPNLDLQKGTSARSILTYLVFLPGFITAITPIHTLNMGE